MDERIRAFLAQNQAASMVTLRRDGSPHAARVGVGLIGDKLWSSGTQIRLRTKHLRRDPRSTLFVFPTSSDGYRWLSLDCTVTILDGPDAPQLNLQLMQAFQARTPNPPKPGFIQWFGQDKTIEDFLQTMVDEQRLIYEFAVNRAYGMY